MKIAVIGANGQLGTELVKQLSKNHEVVKLTHADVEVSDISRCQILKESKPDAIINTAASHKVDACEDDPVKTFSVNSVGAKNIASIAKELNAVDVYISTDYVFDGRKSAPYTEEDIPSPVNTYGISKLSGEFLTKLVPKHYIVRIASVFGVAGASGKGGNFVDTMVKKAKNNEAISVVDDMIMSPTYAKDAAVAIEKMLDKGIPYGVYHAANGGYCSWFQFTKEIIRQAGLQPPSLSATKTNVLAQKALRPMFSALSPVKLKSQGIPIRDWKEALGDYLKEKGHIE